jgi:hypothetical protein
VSVIGVQVIVEFDVLTQHVRLSLTGGGGCKVDNSTILTGGGGGGGYYGGGGGYVCLSIECLTAMTAPPLTHFSTFAAALLITMTVP